MGCDLPFLAGHDCLPWTSAKLRGAKLRGFVRGPGTADSLQVLVGDWEAPPKQEDLRSLWKERNAGKPFPLVVVALYQLDNRARAAICGPIGEDPPAHLDLDVGQIERMCEAALQEPDRHAAIRYLSGAIQALEGVSVGIRNEGLFATHELEQGVPQRSDWTEASLKSRQILRHRGKELLRALGYAIEPLQGPTSLLKVQGRNIAVAVFLHRGESPDLAHRAFSDMSPVSYALARADELNVPYVIIETGSALRIHSTDPKIGVGRRGRTDTFFEIQLDLLPDPQAGYLWLIFAAENLAEGGAFGEILEHSGDYASDLGARLRERIYRDVMPPLAQALVTARRLRRPGAEKLRETFQAALFLLFRLLFVAYAEDKQLLPYRTNGLYRKRSLKQIARDLVEVGERETKEGTNLYGPDPILWGQLTAIFQAIRNGNRAWGVPEYGGALFSDDAQVSPLGALLEGIEIPDAALGPILAALLIDEAPEGRGPVDFRSLGVREFGTIYEGLLEQELSVAETDLAVDKSGFYRPVKGREPVVVPAGRVYLHNASGARKATGSYYTKGFAVDHLLDHALEPALDAHVERMDKLPEPEAGAEFFRFYIADIAMGSGHFLVAAVDRIEAKLSRYLARRPLPGVTEELRRLRATAEQNLGSLAAGAEIEDTQLLRRQIARRCIYGVDLNPMAAQLARLSLWIHTFVPGLPLGFLDHGLVEGNSLVGIGTFEEVQELLERVLGQTPDLFLPAPETLLAKAQGPLEKLGHLSDGTKAEIAAARKALADARAAIRPAETLLDILSATRLDEELAPALKSALGNRALAEAAAALPDGGLHARARKTLRAVPPFHFPIVFPEVFLRERPGFDVIVGNPPWQEATIEEDAFWARHAPGLRSLPQREQESRKRELHRERPDLAAQLEREQEEAEVQRRVLTTGPFPGMGTGDPDLYKAFCWRFWKLAHDCGGWVGVVLPRSALSAKGSAEFRTEVFERAFAVDVTTLLNTKGWVFDEAEHRYTIGLVCFEKRARPKRTPVALRGPYPSYDRYRAGMVREPAVFPGDEIETWSDTASLPLLPTEESIEVFVQLRKAPRLDLDDGKSWRARPYTELHATNDKQHMDLKSKDCPKDHWPVYKGESFDLWTPDTGHYYAWADPEKVLPVLQEKRLRAGQRGKGVGRASGRRMAGANIAGEPAEAKRTSPFGEFDEKWLRDPKTLPCLRPRIAFRDVSRATDSRTMRVALVPPQVFITNKGPYLLWPRGSAQDEAFLLGMLSSRILDWYARRFVEVSFNFFIFNPLPIPRLPAGAPLRLRVIALAGRLAAQDARLANWAAEVGVPCGPLSDAQRDDMIAELDAVAARLYGLSERQLVHVFETFHEGWEHQERLRATLVHFRTWKG